MIRDTVSSLGLITGKRDIHPTSESSTSVTNGCHFQHGFALDECCVELMSEYFSEVNAHRSNIRSPRPAVGDIKEVQFAGSHFDVYVTIVKIHTRDEPDIFSQRGQWVAVKRFLIPRATSLHLCPFWQHTPPPLKV